MAVTYRLSATAAGYQLKRALLTLGHRPSYPVLCRRTVGHGRFCRPPQAAAPEVRSPFEVSRRYHMGFVSGIAWVHMPWGRALLASTALSSGAGG